MLVAMSAVWEGRESAARVASIMTSAARTSAKENDNYSGTRQEEEGEEEEEEKEAQVQQPGDGRNRARTTTPISLSSPARRQSAFKKKDNPVAANKESVFMSADSAAP
ncbi:unnamed protein product, partial [Amoebophrya sp. A120]|eukprot:GSA120T00013434001.1